MGRKIRILHVDDNIHDRKLVKDALLKEHNEFEIIEADSREKFEKYLSGQNFDLVLSDFNILGFDGLQVLEIVKNMNPGLPVIIVTGTGSEEIAIQAMKMGASDYVIKSVKHIHGLEPTIQMALRNKKEQEERKRAEDALRESEAHFRDFFENSMVGKSITGIDSTLIDINKAFCEILGYSKTELNKKKWEEITYPEDIQISADFFQSLISGKLSSARFEKRYVHKNGTIIWADVATYLKRNKNGNPEYFITTIIDTTERKRAAEAIRQERILLRTLIDNLPDTIYVKDAEGRKLIANAADMKLMNIKSEEEIIGKTDVEIYKNEAGERGYTEDMNVLKTGKPLMNHEECFIDPDGNNRWLLTTKLPLYNEQKQIIGLVGMGHDITARKQSEEQLLIAKDKAEESDRLKTAFLHNISHEIRTPMNAIVGFSGFLNDPGLPSEKRKHFTEILVQSSNQLLSIITDIINISTIETGQVTLIEKAVNINYLMKIVYEQFSIIAEKKGVIFRYKTALSDHAAIISTDNTKLIEILSNLLSNALKFTKQGHVNFGYLLKEDYLEFYVEDTGIGIPPKMHDEIFKRFRQMETTANRKYGGSGLGLSISKAYVELLGGKIWVHSELTKGAVFYFTIPYKKISLNKQSEEQFSNSLNQEIENPATILIAEDEDSNYLLMEELLSDMKCINIRAFDGLEAVEICKSNPNIDLVLMDIKMPEMDGYEATRQIRKFNPTVPIIAQTAHALADDRDIALEAGCTDYISKPINGQLLIEMVQKYLYQEKRNNK